MSQTSYSLIPGPAVLGGIADNRYNDYLSRASEGALYLGCLAVHGTLAPGPTGTPGQAKEIVDSAANVDNYIGIPIWESGKEPYTVSLTKSQIASGTPWSFMREGRIWVYVENAVTPASVVAVRVLTVAADVKGQFRAATTTNFVAAPGWFKFVTSTAGAGLAQLEIG